MTEVPEYDPTPVPADTAPEHLEAIATTDAVLELPPEKSGFGEGNVGEVLLDIVGLSKSFGSVKANRDISMHVRRGEIVALLGENGAGKSTLVNQIFGLITPDTGTVSVRGDATPIKDPRDAIARGIGMVHQHFQLVPVMTVAENMMLGHEPTKAGQVLDIKSAREMVRTLSAKHGLPVDPDAEIEDLPVGTQQRVEILKAL
jgi:general nucleoside transport system ATP-binding protein